MNPKLSIVLRDMPDDHHVWRIGGHYVAAKTQRQAELRYIAEFSRPQKILRKQYAEILLDEFDGEGED